MGVGIVGGGVVCSEYLCISISGHSVLDIQSLGVVARDDDVGAGDGVGAPVVDREAPGHGGDVDGVEHGVSACVYLGTEYLCISVSGHSVLDIQSLGIDLEVPGPCGLSSFGAGGLSSYTASWSWSWSWRFI